MIRIIHWLLHGCWHDYRPINVPPVDHYDVSFGGRDFMYRTLPTCCTKCGRLSFIKDRTGTLTYDHIKGDDV